MLVLRYFDFDKENDVEKGVHVGVGRIKTLFPSNAMYLEVQADGHELEKIKQQFSNIPMHNGRVVLWTGEIAYFIANNLKL